MPVFSLSAVNTLLFDHHQLYIVTMRFYPCFVCILRCSVKSIIPKNYPEISYKQLTRSKAGNDLVHHSLQSKKVFIVFWIVVPWDIWYLKFFLFTLHTRCKFWCCVYVLVIKLNLLKLRRYEDKL